MTVASTSSTMLMMIVGLGRTEGQCRCREGHCRRGGGGAGFFRDIATTTASKTRIATNTTTSSRCCYYFVIDVGQWQWGGCHDDDDRQILDIRMSQLLRARWKTLDGRERRQMMMEREARPVIQQLRNDGQARCDYIRNG